MPPLRSLALLLADPLAPSASALSRLVLALLLCVPLWAGVLWALSDPWAGG